VVEEEEEEEDKDEDDGKDPRMIGQGEMVNTSATDADTMVDDEPTVLAEQDQEMREQTRRPQPHGQKPRRLPHDHTLRRLIPSVGYSSCRL
jgi:hypothetical protein